MAPAVSGQGPVPPVVISLLLAPPGDATSGEVVRRHLHRHLVTGEDTDEVHAELSGDMGQDNVPIPDVHMEGRVGQGLGDDPFQLDHIAFCQA